MKKHVFLMSFATVLVFASMAMAEDNLRMTQEDVHVMGTATMGSTVTNLQDIEPAAGAAETGDTNLRMTQEDVHVMGTAPAASLQDIEPAAGETSAAAPTGDTNLRMTQEDVHMMGIQ